jgi:hypothetical protein
MNLITLKRKI